MISNYDEAIEKIFTTEAMRDYSLERVAGAYELLGRPLDDIQVIHIAGTNGKGSVARMTFSILQQAKKSVGIFTSPHLIDIRERFATDTGLISETEFVEYTNRLLSLPFALSYFEKCTLIAMLLFAERRVQYAILEVGIGGRLDATNICTPTITAITSIGLDHQQYLGDTLEAIATEKAGIVKSGVPIILSDTNPTIESIALDRKAPLIITHRRHQTNLHGAHQQHNAAIAYEIAHYLGIHDQTIHTGLQSVEHLGRCHHLRPNLLIDGAHNPEGLTILQDYIQTLDYDQIVYCIGLKSGKSPSIILDKFSADATYMIIDHEHSMTTDPHDLQSQLTDRGITAPLISPHNIIQQANQHPNHLYIVCGSLYMIGQFYTDIQKDDVILSEVEESG